jgi:hypothetical protein
METSTPAANERFPTVGPDPRSYETYRFETTDDGYARICEESAPAAWVESSHAVSLDEWC